MKGNQQIRQGRPAFYSKLKRVAFSHIQIAVVKINPTPDADEGYC